MGFIYRKSLKAGPFRINLSKSGVGLSAGVPGFRVTQSSTGRRYTTFNVPGSGMSYRTPATKSGQSAQGCLVPIVGFLGLAAGGLWWANRL
jgi:hypothetical protein